MSTVTPSGSSNPPRSNKYFKQRALKKHIAYQICLSQSRNPDFVVRYPNELQAKNSDWKKEIIKRVNQEESVRLKLISVRLAKRTSLRRLNQFDE